ncbi:50S ribosomal protein L29 [Candidatus Zinderia endosymbiont of Aphrophora alni]|uniref:50S ribosomal protein L29 n=1 Tax=Candidatus Zinderia endosymbiont of Aphrophora alni TaxID=3077951 RepID=UPI0030CE8563
MKKKKKFILKIKNKDIKSLKFILINFIKKKFFLKTQIIFKKVKNFSKLKMIRKNIARIKTIINEKKNENN